MSATHRWSGLSAWKVRLTRSDAGAAVYAHSRARAPPAPMVSAAGASHQPCDPLAADPVGILEAQLGLLPGAPYVPRLAAWIALIRAVVRPLETEREILTGAGDGVPVRQPGEGTPPGGHHLPHTRGLAERLLRVGRSLAPEAQGLVADPEIPGDAADGGRLGVPVRATDSSQFSRWASDSVWDGHLIHPGT
jgi:hypothetical protein